MLTVLVKTAGNTNNNILAKVLPIPILLLRSIANTNTNTNTFATILFTVYYILQRSFLSVVIY